MTDRIIWLDYAAAVERVGPRPKTDYSRPVACPECGLVRPQGQRSRFCVPCRDTGHSYRLMDAQELRWRASVWAAQGYPNMTRLVLDVAETLEAAAASRSDAEIDALLFGMPADEVVK